MESWLEVALLTLMAGIAMPVGALAASSDHFFPAWLEDEFHHSVIAFGGGALLSAVALVLVPEGINGLSIPEVVFWFSCGGLAFMVLDILLARSNSPASQLAAMLSDFLPEAAALGAAFAVGGESGVLLAILMTVQNVPEAFNAYREITATGKLTGRQVVFAFFAMSFLGPTFGLVGYFWLSGYPVVISAIMLVASGGILYAIFQDIAVQVPLKQNWRPPLGALGGFLVGLIGQMLLTS